MAKLNVLGSLKLAHLLGAWNYGDSLLYYIEARDKPLALYVYSDNAANVQKVLSATYPAA